MRVRYQAAVAIIVIMAGVIGSLYGAWAGDLPIAALSLITFVAGFLIGNHVAAMHLPDKGEGPDE
jgi:hypothetical protein